ncbi:MAG TPA: ABC transporter permease [Firmicutes bacterium]|nr:ABC transporter permease [Bacillota bacterium]
MPKRNASSAEWQGVTLLGINRRTTLQQKEMGVLIATIATGILFTIFARNFISWANLVTVLTMASELGIVAIGMTFLLISGEIDLSVGSVFATIPLIMAMLFVYHGISEWIGMGIALLVAAGIGYLNGQITIGTGIPSFITTLGMMMFWRGIVLALTGGRPVAFFGRSTLLAILGGLLPGGVRAVSIWFVVLVFILWLVLEKMRYGNWVVATGGNKDIARELGVNVRKVKLINFTLTAVLAGFAGCIQFARLGSASPAYGEGLELEAIAASVIGGTSLVGGYGSILGTFLGALLMAIIRSGLVLAGAPAYWYRSFVGAIVIIAVIINRKLGSGGSQK